MPTFSRTIERFGHQAKSQSLAFAALQAHRRVDEPTVPRSKSAMADVMSGGGPSERHAALGQGMDHTPPPRHNAVRAAGRHSARVRFLRRAMIVGSSIGISVVAIVALFDPLHHMPHGLSIAGVGIEGTIVTMAAPKISGLRTDGGAYSITALQGLQDITKPSIMELKGVDALIGMVDKTSARITADSGLYDGKLDTMTLSGHARIKNKDSGYDLAMRSAVMNFKTGVFSSREPLQVDISGGSVSANQLDITESGHKISFADDVTSVFQSSDDDAPATPSAAR